MNVYKDIVEKDFFIRKVFICLANKTSNDEKNVLIFYFHVDNDNVCEALHS